MVNTPPIIRRNIPPTPSIIGDPSVFSKAIKLNDLVRLRYNGMKAPQMNTKAKANIRDNT
jgi:hypothetical protein